MAAANVVARSNRRTTIEWDRAILAGVIAMTVFAAIEMTFAWAVRGASPWRPLDIFGAIVLGQSASEPVVSHTGATALVGALVLLALGMLSGVIIALLVHRLHAALVLAVGALFGVAMYYVDMYGFARIFPSLALLRGWSSLFAYAVQGGLAAGLYRAMTRSIIEAAPERGVHDMRRMREVPLV
jgi:hypothetical protein